MKNRQLKVIIALSAIGTALLVSCAGMNVDGNKSLSTSKILIKGKSQLYGLWIDKNKWREQKIFNNNEPNVDLQIVHKSYPADLGLATFFVHAEYGLDNLKALTIKNLRKNASDLTIKDEEKKWINNNEVIYFKAQATVNYLPLSYAFYLYSEQMGSIQICVFGSRNVFEKYESDIFDALDGFVVPTSSNRDDLLEPPQAENNIEIKLEKLNTLLQKGIINQQEYDKKKEELLNQL